jgi:secondary thiamine-phosphate synthase enzyme
MQVTTTRIEIKTTKQFELIDITSHVQHAVAESGIANGNVVVFNPHTTASIRLNQNEPLLLQDIFKMLYRVAPADSSYSHDLFELRTQVEPGERSNGHAHVKAFLLGSSESLLVTGGKLLLGGKQSVFFIEFDGGRLRDFYIQIIGE